MAVIGAAHGIKGELRVKAFTGDPLALADYGPLLHGPMAAPSRSRTSGRQGTVVVVRFKGLRRPQRGRGADRHRALRGPLRAARRRRRRRVLSRRSGRVWWCRTKPARRPARVTAVQDFGGGDLLELDIGRPPGHAHPLHRSRGPGGRHRRRIPPHRYARGGTWRGRGQRRRTGPSAIETWRLRRQASAARAEGRRRASR